MRLKRFIVAVVAALPTVFLIPGQASAAICANAINAAVLGDANQDNACETNIGLP
ncbi:MAG: hypothetical protein M3198_03555 [Actinomycetota bacterium]|nr:hypothetical protein [Actinomycetota bacterium]